MSKKISEIREFCGDYALDIEYSQDYTFTMFFNSLRNAQTVRRCLQVDDSVPNAATAVDFVEVVRCRDCKHTQILNNGTIICLMNSALWSVEEEHFCSYGERIAGE